MCQKLEGADEVSKQFFDETIQELVEQQKMEEEEEDEPDENGRVYGSYKRKVFSNLHFCNTSYAFNNSSSIFEVYPTSST